MAVMEILQTIEGTVLHDFYFALISWLLRSKQIINLVRDAFWEWLKCIVMAVPGESEISYLVE